MRVCVVGCGAVGSLFAANLAQLDDVEGWAYDLAREHVDAINRDGLRLSGAGEVVGRLRATTSPAPLRRRPSRLIASTCSRERSYAHTSTSSSCARFAANSEPTAPQPTTQILTSTRPRGL